MLLGDLAKSAVSAKTSMFKTKFSLLGKVGRVALIGVGVTYAAAGAIALWDHNAIKNNKTTLSETIYSKLGHISSEGKSVVDAYKADTAKANGVDLSAGISTGNSAAENMAPTTGTSVTDSSDFDFDSSSEDCSLEMV